MRININQQITVGFVEIDCQRIGLNECLPRRILWDDREMYTISFLDRLQKSSSGFH